MEEEKEIKKEFEESAVCTPVTVAITYCKDEDVEEHLRASIASVKKNLKGVDCNIIVVGNHCPEWLDKESFVSAKFDSRLKPEGLWNVIDALTDEDQLAVQERIILMSSDMMICSPTLLCHIEVPKAVPAMDDTVKMLNQKFIPAFNFNSGTPVLIMRSSAATLAENKELRSLGFVTCYFISAFGTEIKPILVKTEKGQWREDPWLLPIVSDHADVSRIEMLMPDRHFLLLKKSCRSTHTNEILKQLFE